MAEKKSRTWAVTIWVTDTPPGGPVPSDSKFLTVKDVREIAKRFKLTTGYSRSTVKAGFVSVHLEK